MLFMNARIPVLLMRLELSMNAVDLHMPWNTRGERPLNNVKKACYVPTQSQTRARVVARRMGCGRARVKR